ncbi:MAG TPA: hypothetical protein VFP89_07610, partial [Propionibacteriaceae bacterium]|nr:hypothetical protein [Propionibacteriaceae bacterium]
MRTIHGDASSIDSQEGQPLAGQADRGSGPESPSRLILPSDPEFNELCPESEKHSGLSRRAVLKLGAVGAAGVALTAGGSFGQSYLAQKGLLSSNGVFAAAATALTDLVYVEEFPTSPLILAPFKDELPVPKALAPIPASEFSSWKCVPGPGDGQQNSMANERHQIWPSQLGYPDPLVYKIDLLVRGHAFTTSQVLPIDKNGRPA